MSESTVRCPKCGHEGIVVSELLDADLRLIADSQQAEIERLLTECRRLRIKCGPSEMIESDYVPDAAGGGDE